MYSSYINTKLEVLTGTVPRFSATDDGSRSLRSDVEKLRQKNFSVDGSPVQRQEAFRHRYDQLRTKDLIQGYDGRSLCYQTEEFAIN